MKTFTQRALAAALAAAIGGLSLTAIAQNTATPVETTAQAGHKHKGQTMSPEQRAERQQRMQARINEHQQRLKASLQLSAEQEPAWNAFIARMQPQARTQGQRMDRQAWAALSTPERLDRMEAMKAERDRAMAQRNDAIRSFYAQLNPSQQKAFDAQRGLQRAGMTGHGHGHRHQHGGGQHPMHRGAM